MVTIWVCTDCEAVHANGEIGDPDHTPDREPLGLLDGQDVSLGMTFDEHECEAPGEVECECEQTTFSWSRCEGCGSQLGGARAAMTIHEKET